MTNTATADPYLAVGALTLMRDGEADIEHIVGSSFVVRGQAFPNSVVVVTAAHVVTEQPGSVDTPLAFVMIVDDRPRSQVVHDWHVRADLDLAVGRIALLADTHALDVGHWHDQREMVETIEFSSALVRDADGNRVLAPLYRIGYVIQRAHGVHPDLPSVRMLELSFPAFAGSSGAPVFGQTFRTVVGVIVSNLHRDLPPSQVATAYDDQGAVVEEVRYHVPNGLAVSHEHLRDALDSAAMAFLRRSRRAT